MTDSVKRYAVPALDKGLDILELMASCSDEPEGLLQKEIANRLGRSQSEIYRMLVCLESRGYISRSRQDRYRLTARLFALAHSASRSMTLLEHAQPVMRQLGFSCHLVAKRGLRGVVLTNVVGPEPIALVVQAGTVLSLTGTASGRTLLAMTDTKQREEIIRDLEREGSLPNDLGSSLLKVQELGYYLAPSLQVPQVYDLVVPIAGHDGQVVAVLTAPFLSPSREDANASRERLIAQVRTAGEEITQALAGEAEAIVDA